MTWKLSRKNRDRRRKILITGLSCLWLGALLRPDAGMAAEVTGSVEFVYNGIFSTDAAANQRPISVALLPMETAAGERGPARNHVMEISNNRIAPSFMTVQRGDEISFVNKDAVYHQLFSLSHELPFEVMLEKSTREKKVRSVVKLDKLGTAHVFCRIHNKSYARVDVLDTPMQQIVKPGQPFRFTGLKAGKWMLRLASPASETRLIPVDAVTSPPPLRLQLSSHGGGSVNGKLNTALPVESMYR